MNEAGWKGILDNIVELAPVGLVVIDGVGTVVFVNTAAEHVLGLKRGNMIGRRYRDLALRFATLGGKPLSPEGHLFAKVMRTHKPVHRAEHVYERPDWTRAIVSVNAVPLLDTAGAIADVVLSLTDITEFRQVEEALRKERDRAQKYLDVAGVMFVVIDAEQKVTLINKKGLEILGYEEQEVIGKDWFLNFLPERIRHEVKAVFKSLMAGEVEPVEYFENPIMTKSGLSPFTTWCCATKRGRSSLL